MTERTVAAGLAQALLDFAVALGASRDALLAGAGIDAGLLLDPDSRIPFARYAALIGNAKSLTGDPALALHFGESFDLSEMSLVGLIGAASETFQEALAQTNRYARLVVEVDEGRGEARFKTARDASGLWLIDTRGRPNDFPELTESTFARMAATARRFGETAAVKAVHVTHQAPGHRSEYDRIFGVPIMFESDRNAILVDRSWEDKRIALQPRYVFGVLSERAEALLKKLEMAKSTRGQVELHLMPILHTGDASMDKIAALMGVSRWTLARRLKAEGVTFEALLDELRRTLALHYLRGRKVSVNQTAYLLGFSEPAAFSRAFKRWTGKSPRSVRTRAAS